MRPWVTHAITLLRGRGVARIALVAVIAVGLAGGAQVATGAATRHATKHTTKCGKHASRHGRREKTKPCGKRPKPAAAKLHSPGPTPAATTPSTTTPTPAPPTPTTPQCRKLEPLPAPIPGQTTIVGYANVEGGPPFVGSGGCPRLPTGETVLLKNPAGETLQTQTTGKGQPFNFIVEPGEYYVFAACDEDEKSLNERVPFVVRADEQNLDEGIGCSIP